MSNRARATELTLGVALLPDDFPMRLAALKELTGLSWERMATAMGVDSRQLHRWRKGTAPNGEAMLSLVRLATRVPGGLELLLAEDLQVVANPEKG